LDAGVRCCQYRARGAREWRGRSRRRDRSDVV
jgi:hypothetical protein